MKTLLKSHLILIACGFIAAHGFAAGQETAAAMISPAPATVLDGQSQTFTWDAGVGATSYYLEVGSSVGATDYFISGSLNALSVSVPNLPTNGTAVHVRLWTLLPVSSWVSRDYVYTAASLPQITSPVPGSALDGPEVEFHWTERPGAGGYRLEIGSTPGGSEYYDSDSINDLSASVSGLPLDGTTVYARLSTLITGMGWKSTSFTYLTYAITPGRPEDFSVQHIWNGSMLGIPTNLGGLMFSRDGNTLYVVGASETGSSALYSVPVTRDTVTRRVTAIGPPEDVSVVFTGDPFTAGLDAGWDYGPGGTLFYTYWSANRIGQRPGGVSGEETLYNMADIGLPSSVAGLTFSPHLDDTGTGFGMMQVSVWQGANVYNVRMQPTGDGLYQPVSRELFATLPRQGTGAIQYIPSGLYKGNMMYVNWDHGEIMMIEIDKASGLPIDDSTGLPTLGTTQPRAILFASGLGVGPWGLEFDPLTYDFFVTTWRGSPSNSILHFAGAGLPAPQEDLKILLFRREGDTLTLQWQGPAGLKHTVEYSKDLKTWSEHLVVPLAPAVNRHNFPLPTSRAGFFRVRADP